MSDALDYLLQARPEAMRHYFDFLKAGATHLDPRTRALISVITKVAAQTEAGVRQYLPRALRAGATANEVLDALLAAFPILGLSRIVWAIDVIRAMDLPEFDLEALRAASSWHEVAPLGRVPQGASRHGCGERELFVYRDGARLRVYDSRCPHQGTNMPALALDGERLTCPRHGWCFDVRTGACVSGGDRPLREYPARTEAERLLAYW